MPISPRSTGRRLTAIGCWHGTCLPQYWFATNSFWAGNFVRISVP
jgi:hypothetical protein